MFYNFVSGLSLSVCVVVLSMRDGWRYHLVLGSVLLHDEPDNILMEELSYPI